MNRQKRFRDLFRFCEDIRSQRLKIQCQRSQRLWIMRTRCWRSQQLRGHAIFENIKLYFCYFFTFSKVTKFHVCQRSVTIDYADMMSA